MSEVSHAPEGAKTIGPESVRMLLEYPQARREVIDAVREAFRALHMGKAVLLESFKQRHAGGLVATKGAINRNFRVVKIASLNPANAARRIENLQGAMCLLDATTGVPVAFIDDQGLLTHHRTAAAGAVAIEALANPNVRGKILVMGTGRQAKLQLEYAHQVRPDAIAHVWGRTPKKVRACIAEIRAKLPGLKIFPAEFGLQDYRTADIIITATRAQAPIIQSDWVSPGTHINAMGSDAPGKRELDPELIMSPRVTYIPDSLEACRVAGELQGIESLCSAVFAEIGEILSKPGLATVRRNDPSGITIFDSTGLGVQDLAIAEWAYQKYSA